MRHANKTYLFLIILYGMFILSPLIAHGMESTTYQAVALTGTSGKLVGLSSNSYTSQSIAGQSAIGTVTYEGATAQNSNLGFLYVLGLSSSEIENDYEVYDIQAFSHSSNEEIRASIWQLKNDPYFVWKVNVPNNPETIAGYSVSLDTKPDDTVDTTDTFYDGFYSVPVHDGKHKFYVKVGIGGGSWNDPTEFEFWIDTAPPSVSGQTPSPGSLTNDSKPLISAKLQDTHSGVDPESIKLTVDGTSLNFDYNSGLVSSKPTSALTDGSRTVKLEAKDLAGNTLNTAWGFTVDANKPTGSIMINGGDQTTSAARVRLNLEAKDDTTQVTDMIISNDGVFDTEKWESFKSTRTDWILDNPHKVGNKTVHCMFKDDAGNISTIYKSSINLITPAIETTITRGPYSPTKDMNANFMYQASMSGAKFRYKLDNNEWSEWTSATTATFSDLKSGNHVFSVKAAKDLNGDDLITEDEEDPIPAQWTWVITSLAPEKPEEEKVLYWRTE